MRNGILVSREQQSFQLLLGQQPCSRLRLEVLRATEQPSVTGAAGARTAALPRNERPSTTAVRADTTSFRDALKAYRSRIERPSSGMRNHEVVTLLLAWLILSALAALVWVLTRLSLDRGDVRAERPRGPNPGQGMRRNASLPRSFKYELTLFPTWDFHRQDLARLEYPEAGLSCATSAPSEKCPARTRYWRLRKRWRGCSDRA